MIERITLYKLLDEHCHEEARAEARRALRDGLGGIAGVESVRVGWPSDAPSLRSWDVAVIATFADQNTAEAVMQSEAWHAVVHTEVGARAIVTKGWTFEMEA